MIDDVLVLWDIDGTLLNAGGVGRDLYDRVFTQLFGRSLAACAPMAGRTDRAIILETLTLAGVDEPRRYVDPFIAGLGAHAPAVRTAVAERGRPLPGAAEALAAVAAASGAAVRAAVPVPTARVAVASTVAILPARGGGPGGGGRPTRRVHQSVLTGNIRLLAEVKLAALGLCNGLDLCIGAYGDDHEDRTELVQVARRRAAAVHGRDPAAFVGTSTVVIGDTPLDVAAALAAGARTVGVATGSYTAADLRKAGAHAVLPDLTDTDAVLQALLGLAPFPAERRVIGTYRSAVALPAPASATVVRAPSASGSLGGAGTSYPLRLGQGGVAAA
jgi:phosphoglycolate phosphatase-like HAD superfamily hydrolase